MGTAATGGSRAREGRNQIVVFYGRDQAVADDLMSLLRVLGLDPRDFSGFRRQAGKSSPYVGEIVEAGLESCVAAVVLMTPDDLVQLDPALVGPQDPIYERTLMGQPRPNVIYEAGLATGHGTPVVYVVCGDQRPMFSDIRGKWVVNFDASPEARQDLVDALRDAGCPVQQVGQGWLRVGAFRVRDSDAPVGAQATEEPGVPGQGASGPKGGAAVTEDATLPRTVVRARLHTHHVIDGIELLLVTANGEGEKRFLDVDARSADVSLNGQVATLGDLRPDDFLKIRLTSNGDAHSTRVTAADIMAVRNTITGIVVDAHVAGDQAVSLVLQPEHGHAVSLRGHPSLTREGLAPNGAVVTAALDDAANVCWMLGASMVVEIVARGRSAISLDHRLCTLSVILGDQTVMVNEAPGFKCLGSRAELACGVAQPVVAGGAFNNYWRLDLTSAGDVAVAQYLEPMEPVGDDAIFVAASSLSQAVLVLRNAKTGSVDAVPGHQPAGFKDGLLVVNRGAVFSGVLPTTNIGFSGLLPEDLVRVHGDGRHFAIVDTHR